MARKATLTNERLLPLGADKLARLIIDEAEHNAPFRKVITAAVAGLRGPDAVAAIIDRRLASLAKARGFIDWQKRKAFAGDLKATFATIADELGRADPAAAAERLMRFLACAEEVLERVDDTSGQVQGIFEDAASALATLARVIPEASQGALVANLVQHMSADGRGLIATALAEVVPALSPASLAQADALLLATIREIGPVSDQDWQRRSRRTRLVAARQAIADRTGDVDAFIALEQERSGGGPDTLEIAERLLAAGRVSEALDWVRKPVRPGLRAMRFRDIADGAFGIDVGDRQRVRLEVLALTALGQRDAAQALRWQTFEATLDAEMLRDHIRHLPDFDEFEVLERAFAHAAARPERYGALAFFLEWPRLDLAAKLVVDRRAGWNGRHYDDLTPAAEALRHDYPTAATILYRALIDDVLARGRAPAYGHAARHLAQLGNLDAEGVEALGLPDHAAYGAGLEKVHGRKTAFWAAVETIRKKPAGSGSRFLRP